MNIENPLNIEEVELLIQAMDDWMTANKNEAMINLINSLAYVQSKEQLDKLKDQIQNMKMKQKDKLKAQREKGILLQAKLIQLKQKILLEMPKFNGGK